MQEGTKSLNPVLKFVQYLREAKEELGKVAWPSRQNTIRYASFVIGTSVVVAVFLGVLDWGLTIGLEQLIALTQK